MGAGSISSSALIRTTTENTDKLNLDCVSAKNSEILQDSKALKELILHYK